MLYFHITPFQHLPCNIAEITQPKNATKVTITSSIAMEFETWEVES